MASSSRSSSASSPQLNHQISIKLTSDNYLLWKTQFLPMVSGCGLKHHLDLSTPPPAKTNSDGTANPNYSQWETTDQLVFSWIASSLSERVLSKIVGLTTANEAWTKLQTVYASGNRAQIRELRGQLHNLQRDSLSIDEYMSNIKLLSDRLTALGQSVSDDDLVEFACNGLGPTYSSFVRLLDQSDATIDFDELHARLLTEERRLKKDEKVAVVAPSAQFSQSQYNARGRGRG